MSDASIDPDRRRKGPRLDAPRAEQATLGELFLQMQSGDPDAWRTVWILLLDELWTIARSLMSQERSDHTLQPTALVDEAYVRLFGQRLPPVMDREHFIRLARRIMKHVLVEHARRLALRRELLGPSGVGPQLSAELAERLLGSTGRRSEELPRLEAIEAGLEQLWLRHPDRAEACHMQSVLGMQVEEIARALDKPPTTIQSWLRYGRAFLRDYVHERLPDEGGN